MPENSIAARAKAAQVPARTVNRWIKRGELSADATAAQIRAFAKQRRLPKQRKPTGQVGRSAADTPSEVRAAVERGELRLWTPTDPAERARYGLPPLEGTDAG